MELLFVFFAFIAVLMIIARLASKTRPDSERAPEPPAITSAEKLEKPEEATLLNALVELLIRKNLISEQELRALFEEISHPLPEDKVLPKNQVSQ